MTEPTDAPTLTAVPPLLQEALAGIGHFITETTGTPPSDAELADALNRYFVLNEIKEHIEMLRAGG